MSTTFVFDLSRKKKRVTATCCLCSHNYKLPWKKGQKKRVKTNFNGSSSKSVKTVILRNIYEGPSTAGEIRFIWLSASILKFSAMVPIGQREKIEFPIHDWKRQIRRWLLLVVETWFVITLQSDGCSSVSQAK